MSRPTSKCESCNVRVPKHIPMPVCDICLELKHPRCNGLSKLDAKYIIESNLGWSCKDCISSILPVGAATPPPRNLRAAKFKIQCKSCSGMSYTPTNVKVCGWCNESVHKKCLIGELGCKVCCEQMIPGFNASYIELYGMSSRTNNVTYNPYDRDYYINQIGDSIENNEEHSSLWNDISNFLVNCKYQQLSNVGKSKENEMKILSLNIRSLVSKISDIRDEINNYSKFDVICFNETGCQLSKLANGMPDLFLEGFHQPIIQDPVRKSGRGGGLAIYVNSRVCEDTEIDIIDTGLEKASYAGEFLVVRIRHCKGSNESKIICNIYRSPSHKEPDFFALQDAVLEKLNRFSSKHVLLVGDYNMDLIKHSSNTHCQHQIDTAAQHGFMQIVSRPTRITDHSATLIDHVYSNSLEKTISCNILTVDLSDHLAILTTISLAGSHKSRSLKHRINLAGENTERRIFNAANDAVFTELIGQQDWSAVINQPDANSMYDSLSEIYDAHYNTAYPLIKNRIKRKNERKEPQPWILPWLEGACARKNLLYREFIKKPTVENSVTYKKLAKFCKKHCDKAKKKYQQKYFVEHKSNSKMQWQMINNLLNRNQKVKSTIKLHNDDGDIVSSNDEVSEKFNKYFSNIATNIKAKISVSHPFDPGGQTKFLNNPVPHSIFLSPSTGTEIHDIIKTFKNKATLDTRIGALKAASNSVSFLNSMSTVINKSLEEGFFPTALKTARVIPIHKAGSKTEVSNYRPISLLSTFSKIYEKIMHGRVLNFLESNNSLHEMQYGFRPGRSCEHALLAAQNSIQNALSRKQVTLLLLIDFSKAFDLVDHEILLGKLQHYGIRGPAYKWFESYLKNRQQFVTINGIDSSTTPLTYGVPQGSILGPLLFIIYINDLPGISSLAKFILYADDANIIITGSCHEEVYIKARELSNKLVDWVNSNGLSLNLKKTIYMIFGGTRKTTNERFFIGGTEIEKRSDARFLGVIMDDKLTWSKHISAIKARMSRYFGIMFKLKRWLPLGPRLQIFHSFVQSHINYCSLVWGFAAKSHIDSLFSKQKTGMRAIIEGKVFTKYEDGKLPTRTKSFFNKYKILSVHNIITKNALVFIHKLNHFPDMLPESVRDTISQNRPVSRTNEMDAAVWQLSYGSTHFKKSLFFKGPLLYVQDLNSSLIDSNIMLSVSLQYYKTAIKRELLKSQIGNDDDDWPLFLLNHVQGLRSSSRIRDQLN